MEKAKFKKGQKVSVKNARNGTVRDAVVIGEEPSLRGVFVLVKYADGTEGRPRPSQLTAK